MAFYNEHSLLSSTYCVLVLAESICEIRDVFLWISLLLIARYEKEHEAGSSLCKIDELQFLGHYIIIFLERIILFSESQCA